MDILVVGGGGREHAIIMKLAESPRVNKLYCTPGNGGISRYAECFDVKATDIGGVVALAKKLKVDMVAVAPDDPLVLGMVDALNAEGIMTFGPNKAAAIIEGSKVFSKHLMKKYNIPTAGYEVFSDSASAIAYLKEQNTYPAVIKADGLALGKGVIIAQNEEEAVEAVKSMIDDKQFGESSATVVIEEFLTGPEVSVLSFTDGKTVVPMIASQDHKRIFDGDKGPNTGGMGTYAPAPVLTNALRDEAMKTILEPMVAAMEKEGMPYVGCLYAGLMITPQGPKVVEFNARFGDPETQVVLPLLDSDLGQIMMACATGTLTADMVKWKDSSAACVILASKGYPETSSKGDIISGDIKQHDTTIVFHSGTKLIGDEYVTNGGRVLCVVGLGKDLRTALDRAYGRIEHIDFEGMQYRTDIGAKAFK